MPLKLYLICLGFYNLTLWEIIMILVSAARVGGDHQEIKWQHFLLEIIMTLINN